MFIYEVLNRSALKLHKVLKDKRFAYTAAEMLLMHAMKVTREELYIIYRDKISSTVLKKFVSCVNRRIKGEPLQYILKKWWFYGREFAVRKGVLIPRQDTEAVIEAVKSVSAGLQDAEAADAGCGTGIIGITLKLEIPVLRSVTCVDISQKAVTLTGYNAGSNHARVACVKGDFFSLAGRRRRKFGLVVSNPPYVSEQALKRLQREVKHEPKTALSAGTHGLQYYRKFAEQPYTYLRNGGYLVLEIGDKMGQKVRKLFSGSEWRFVNAFRDFKGIERALVFNFRSQIPISTTA